METQKGEDKTTGSVSGQISVSEDGKIRNIYIKEDSSFQNVMEGNYSR